MPNLGAVVTLFGVDGLLLFFMVFHYKSMFRSCGPDGSLGLCVGFDGSDRPVRSG